MNSFQKTLATRPPRPTTREVIAAAIACMTEVLSFDAKPQRYSVFDSRNALQALLDAKGLIILKPEEVGEAMDRAAEQMRERCAKTAALNSSIQGAVTGIRSLSLRGKDE